MRGRRRRAVTRHRAATARTLACMSPAARAATLTVRRSTRFVTWVRSWRAGLVPYDEVAAEIAEAEGELNAALAEATAQLARLDVARWRPELAGALATLRRPDFAGDLPPGYDARARRLYARATVLDGVLTLAGQSAPGGAVTGYEAQRRDEALRPLTMACRRAMAAACNAPLI